MPTQDKVKVLICPFTPDWNPACHGSLVLSNSPGQVTGLSAVKTQPFQESPRQPGNSPTQTSPEAGMCHHQVPPTYLEFPGGGFRGRGSGSRLRWYSLWLGPFPVCDRHWGLCRCCSRAPGRSRPPAGAPWDALPGLGARRLSLENVLGRGS